MTQTSQPTTHWTVVIGMSVRLRYRLPYELPGHVINNLTGRVVAVDDKIAHVDYDEDGVWLIPIDHLQPPGRSQGAYVLRAYTDDLQMSVEQKMTDRSVELMECTGHPEKSLYFPRPMYTKRGPRPERPTPLFDELKESLKVSELPKFAIEQKIEISFDLTNFEYPGTCKLRVSGEGWRRDIAVNPKDGGSRFLAGDGVEGVVEEQMSDQWEFVPLLAKYVECKMREMADEEWRMSEHHRRRKQWPDDQWGILGEAHGV